MWPDRSALALALRNVRHGKRALGNGYHDAATIHLQCARTWLGTAYGELFLRRPHQRTPHAKARVRLVQRVVDDFAIQITIAERGAAA